MYFVYRVPHPTSDVRKYSAAVPRACRQEVDRFGRDPCEALADAEFRKGRGGAGLGERGVVSWYFFGFLVWTSTRETGGFASKLFLSVSLWVLAIAPSFQRN